MKLQWAPRMAALLVRCSTMTVRVRLLQAVEAVADAVRRHGVGALVVDPVLVATRQAFFKRFQPMLFPGFIDFMLPSSVGITSSNDYELTCWKPIKTKSRMA